MKWVVTIETIHTTDYEIDAPTLEESIDLVFEGKGKEIDAHSSAGEATHAEGLDEENKDVIWDGDEEEEDNKEGGNVS